MMLYLNTVVLLMWSCTTLRSENTPMAKKKFKTQNFKVHFIYLLITLF